MGDIKIIIDGKEILAKSGDSVLLAALNAGIYIPHLCHHPDLPDIGSCRLCLVQYEGNIVPSCTLKVQDGMVITTKNEKIDKKRRTSMELILAAHPEECSTCPKYGQCELQTMMQYLGVSPERMRRRNKMIAADERNPLIIHDMNRCVLCGRCVRVCQKVRGVSVMDYRRNDSGEFYTGPVENHLLMDDDCRFCQACVSVCPTGSIRDKLAVNPQPKDIVPCKNACPAGTNIPEYVRLVKEGKYGQAAAVIHEKLPIPKILGHICSHPCESECKRSCLNEPVSIRNLKLAAVENDTEMLWKKRQKHLPSTGKRIAVIGAGPAGLSAAFYLSKQGHDVTVFEAQAVAGGMVRTGIPAYRMPRNVVEEEVCLLQESGFKIIYNKKITDIRALKEKYDAVLNAVGAHEGVRLPIAGNDAQGVLTNIDFLRNASLGKDTGMGKNVLVLGGGNVAFDCARTAVRLGASKVSMACLESETTIPGDSEEVTAALEEGIEIYYNKTFKAIVVEDGSVTGVATEDVDDMYFDENKKLHLTVRENSGSVIAADTVIFATGQWPYADSVSGLETFKGTYIVVDEHQQTSMEGVFAAGDVTYGTASVVKAVASGRCAASAIDRYLGGDGDIDETLVDLEPHDPWIGREEGFGTKVRVSAVLEDAHTRIHNFDRVEKTLTCAQVCAEAGRCLQCDLRLDLQKPKTWNDYSQMEG